MSTYPYQNSEQLNLLAIRLNCLLRTSCHLSAAVIRYGPKFRKHFTPGRKPPIKLNSLTCRSIHVLQLQISINTRSHRHKVFLKERLPLFAFAHPRLAHFGRRSPMPIGYLPSKIVQHRQLPCDPEKSKY